MSDKLISEIELPKGSVFTHQDFIDTIQFCKNTLSLYKKDDSSMTEQQKIDSYKSYCFKVIHEKYKFANYDYAVELNKNLNIVMTTLIIAHLKD